MATPKTLSAKEAAALLHVDVKQVQRLAREGKLPARRLGRKWLFLGDQLEQMLAPDARSAGGRGPALHISARNRLRGTIASLHIDGLMAEVTLRIGDQELVAVITRSSVERLGLKVGEEALALVKSTEVMIGRGETSA
jgi:molybdopterin-binding protein